MKALLILILTIPLSTHAQSDDMRIALDECLKTNNITPLEYNKNPTNTDKELITSCLSRKGFSRTARSPGQARRDAKEAEQTLAP